MSGAHPYSVDEVLMFEQELGRALLEWSWEGTLQYEETLEKVAAAYGYTDAVAIVGAQSAVVQIAGRHVITKCGIPEFPPLAAVPALDVLLEEVYAGALSPAEAGIRLRRIRKMPPVYPLALRYLGGILLASLTRFKNLTARAGEAHGKIDAARLCDIYDIRLFNEDGTFKENGGVTKPSKQDADLTNFQMVSDLSNLEVWLKVPPRQTNWRHVDLKTFFAD